MQARATRLSVALESCIVAKLKSGVMVVEWESDKLRNLGGKTGVDSRPLAISSVRCVDGYLLSRLSGC